MVWRGLGEHMLRATLHSRVAESIWPCMWLGSLLRRHIGPFPRAGTHRLFVDRCDSTEEFPLLPGYLCCLSNEPGKDRGNGGLQGPFRGIVRQARATPKTLLQIGDRNEAVECFLSPKHRAQHLNDFLPRGAGRFWQPSCRLAPCPYILLQQPDCYTSPANCLFL